MSDPGDLGTPEAAVPIRPPHPYLPRALRALRHRNYRLFCVGLGASLIGSWMAQTALPWLVYGLTESTFVLGVVSCCGLMPSLVLAPFAGAVADRCQRRSVLLLTQTIALTQALLLAALTAAGGIEVWQIMALALVGGIAGGFSLPAVQAFVAETVETRDDLPSAIALTSALNNLARIVGPAFAGSIIAAAGDGRTGEAACFGINALSYLAVLASLLLIATPALQRSAPAEDLKGSINAGFGHVFASPPLRDLLILAAVVGLVGTSGTLLPVFARKIGSGNAATLGLLLGATGAGALLGAWFVGSRPAVIGAGYRIAGGSVLLGVALAGFAATTDLWLAIGFRFLTGLALVIQMTTCTTLVQTITDDDKRGRVLSLFAMAFLGMTPLGSLLSGSLAEIIGAETTLELNGACCLAAAAWFAWRWMHLRQSIGSAVQSPHTAATPVVPSP